MKDSFTCNNSGIRLSEFLSDNLEFVRKTVIKKQIKLGEVRVNGAKTRDDITLNSGDIVTVFLPKDAVTDEFTADIIFEDENILAVYKPPLCDVENHLVKLLSAGRDFLKPLHRLDRNTDGLLIFALNENAYNILYNAFKSRTVDKCYFALVDGVPKHNTALLTAYLIKDEKTYKSLVYSEKKEGAVKIVTQYETVKTYGNFSLLKVKPITGKTHQIRAHLSSIGHSILGDGKYAPKEVLKRFNYNRQQLTAYSICFHELSGGLEYLNGRELKLKEPPFKM